MPAFPSDPTPASAKIQSINPTLVSTAHSLQRQVRSRGGQRWALSLQWPPMRRSQFAPIFAFSVAQRGQFGSFTITAPGFENPAGSWSGTPLVDGASQAGRVVNIKGLTANAALVAKAGDFVKFAGSNKVHMVTADANADGTGRLALAIEPALFSTPVDNAALTFSYVPFTVAFAGDVRETSVSPGGVYTFAADFIEAP